MTAGRAATSPRWSIVTALALLYTAQGIPFGFATEYLPVVLREQGYSYSAIAALGWLQLPWQLKVLWAKTADSPALRPHARTLILAFQIALTLAVAGFALRPLASAPTLWFSLTALAAALAATQDVFVDAFAVRVLAPDERGFGNTAQVAGYRLGMLVGGAALLLLVGRLGERATLLACAGVVAAASVGAFVKSGGAEPEPEPEPEPGRREQATGNRQQATGNAGGERGVARAARPRSCGARTPPCAERMGGGEARARSARGGPPAPTRQLVRHMVGPAARPVLLLAMTFKLGLHMAASLLKPMAKDFGWSKEQIGWAMVTVGSASALAGAAIGGLLHRRLGDRRALGAAIVIQTLVCLPLVAVERLHAPLGITTFAIAIEHFGSGLGTTVLFAALMTATRPSNAGLHYTVLTSANAAAIGIGSMIGGVIADKAGLLAAFVVAAIACALPGILLPRWSAAADASAAEA